MGRFRPSEIIKIIMSQFQKMELGCLINKTAVSG